MVLVRIKLYVNNKIVREIGLTHALNAPASNSKSMLLNSSVLLIETFITFLTLTIKNDLMKILSAVNLKILI